MGHSWLKFTTGDREFPANIFLKNNENKKQLNLFLAKEIVSLEIKCTISKFLDSR